MFKKTYNPQSTVFIFFLIFFSVSCALHPVPCFSQTEKVSKLMPRDTQLLSQEVDKSQELVVIATYKYGSASKKGKILEFYRLLFKNEGFTELTGYSPEKQKAGPHMVYFFSKPNELVVLSLVNRLENGLNIYYIALHKPDTKAIKGFDTK